MCIRVLLLAVSLLLQACNLLGGDGDNRDKSEIAKVCSFADPDIRKKPPDWICSESLDGIAIAALGKAEPHIAGGELYQQNQASIRARARLLEQLKLKAADRIDEYLRNTELSEASSNMQIIQSVQQGISSQSLMGNSEIMRSLLGPDDWYYLLMGMDNNAVRIIIAQAIGVSMAKDQQLWLPYTRQLPEVDLPSLIGVKRLAQ